jgi:predicted metal-dependent peptidase
VAHKAGKLPGIFKTFIEALAEPSVNWKDALRDFLTERNRNDYSWSRPSRRYAGRGVILPGLSNQTPPPLAVFVDTSGSVNHDMVKGFLSDIQGMTDHVSEMVVLWIDAVIQGNPVDIDCSTDITQIQPLGGGGTSFRPGFKWLAEQTDYEPEVVIYFTDGHCRRFPDTPPDLPVLWVLWERNDSFKPPFGEVITMI